MARLHSPTEDGRIDQELGMNQDRVRQANPQRMGGWTKNWGCILDYIWPQFRRGLLHKPASFFEHIIGLFCGQFLKLRSQLCRPSWPRKGLGTIHSSLEIVLSSCDFVWTISEESVQSFSPRRIHYASSMQKPNANANKILRRAYSIRPYNNGGKYRWIMHDYTMILAHPMGEPVEPQIHYPELHLDLAR